MTAKILNLWLFASWLVIFGCSPSNSPKIHVLQIYYLTNDQFALSYEGNGQPGERGWARDREKQNFTFSFQGLHIPNGYVWLAGDTNYIDAFVSGSFTFENSTSYLFSFSCQMTSQVPIKFHFLGISDVTNLNSNKPDAMYEFGSGQHSLSFTGEVNSLLESASLLPGLIKH